MSSREPVIKHTVEPRIIDLGGFSIRRSMPTRATRSVGPWVFFDHFGAHTFPAGNGADVIPHPHINLATVTYLFEGALEHRDSIGTVETIRPRAVDLMIAGAGIVHSERTPVSRRRRDHRLHGLQLWHALPADHEEDAPSFHHSPAEAIPGVDVDGVATRVMIGSAYGVSSPVPTFAQTLYVEAQLAAGRRFDLPRDVPELAVYIVQGSALLVPGAASEGADELAEHHFYVLSSADAGEVITSEEGCRLVLIGGENLGKRYMYWNFVSSRKERIDNARQAWEADSMGVIPGDEDERAPLPAFDSHARLSD